MNCLIIRLGNGQVVGLTHLRVNVTQKKQLIIIVLPYHLMTYGISRYFGASGSAMGHVLTQLPKFDSQFITRYK